MQLFYHPGGYAACQNISRNIAAYTGAGGNHRSCVDGNRIHKTRSSADPAAILYDNPAVAAGTGSSRMIADSMCPGKKADGRSNIAAIADLNRPIAVDRKISADPAIFPDAQLARQKKRPYDLRIVPDLVSCAV